MSGRLGGSSTASGRWSGTASRSGSTGASTSIRGWTPTPDLIIDDDWYLVEKYGGYCVSQYKKVDESDRELLEIVEKIAERGDL